MSTAAPWRICVLEMTGSDSRFARTDPASLAAA